MEHPYSGRRFLIGALACSVLLFSGCGASAPDVGGAGPQTPKSIDRGSITPEAGEIATWALRNSSEVTSNSTMLQLGVTRLDCAGGVTGAVLDPLVKSEQDRIVIRADVEPLPPGAHNCQGNNAVPVTVHLDQPVGKRELVDAACLEDRAIDTAACTNNGVRWRP